MRPGPTRQSSGDLGVSASMARRSHDRLGAKAILDRFAVALPFARCAACMAFVCVSIKLYSGDQALPPRRTARPALRPPHGKAPQQTRPRSPEARLDGLVGARIVLPSPSDDGAASVRAGRSGSMSPGEKTPPAAPPAEGACEPADDARATGPPVQACVHALSRCLPSTDFAHPRPR